MFTVNIGTIHIDANDKMTKCMEWVLVLPQVTLAVWQVHFFHSPL